MLANSKNLFHLFIQLIEYVMSRKNYFSTKFCITVNVTIVYGIGKYDILLTFTLRLQ